MRPVPSDPLAKKRYLYSPPRRRSPATSPSQRPRRTGSVSADQTLSISVSNRSSIRTTPLSSADRRLPRIRLPAPPLLVISPPPFSLVFHGLHRPPSDWNREPRCAAM